jgi:phage-related protein
MAPVYWIGDSREVLAEFPQAVKNEIGFALYCEEITAPHPSIKPLKGFRHAVREIRVRHQGNAYRAVYVVNLGELLYVLHVFQKKSTRGIATPKPDLDRIHARLKQAEQHAKEHQR